MRADRRAGVVQRPPSRYYYEQLPTFQAMVDGFSDACGSRPRSLEDVYAWVLESEGARHDEARAADLADWMSYFDVEPNSLLAIINVVADRGAAARRLYASRAVPRGNGVAR